MAPDSGRKSRGRENNRILLSLLAVAALCGLGFLLAGLFPTSARWPLVELHSTFEAASGFSGLILAILLLVLNKFRHADRGLYLYSACGLLGLSILDVWHASVAPGNLFVWYRVMATFAGAAGFSLLWLPQRCGSGRLGEWLPKAVIVGILFFAVASNVFESRLPMMADGDIFSSFARFVSFLSGTLFFLATIRVVSFLPAAARVDRIFLGSFCFMQCAAAFCFDVSSEWNFTWWWWHFLRVVASFLGVAYVVQLHVDLEEQLRSAIHARNDLISMASHELKTPLTSLTLEIEYPYRLLEKGPPDVDTRALLLPALDRARQRIKLFSVLINNLLQTSRITSGKLKLERAPVDLSKLTELAIQKLGLELTDRGGHFEKRIEPAITALVDPMMIEIAITNLIVNAIKYGRGTAVEVELRRSGSVALISVSDHGPGIAERDQKRIFEKFERADTGSEVGGMGLGLYIVNTIMHQHGGAVGLKSEPGRGCTFTLEVPLQN